MEVRILYCNVGESRYYDGDTNDKPIGGEVLIRIILALK